MRTLFGLLGILAILAGCSDDPTTAIEPPEDEDQEEVVATTFVETFDGDPSAPEPFRSPRWDVTRHSRDRDTWLAPETMDADHGPDCGPPPASHAITQYEDVVFRCRNHVMTALRATGYGLVYLTPNHLVDFSAGMASVEFSMSTLRTSNRDWVDVWISPYDDHLQLALQDWLPSLTGEPRNGVLVQMDLAGNTFKASIVRDGVETEIPGVPEAWFVEYDSFLEPSARRRDKFRLEISAGHVRFGMPDYDHWWVDTDIPALAWDAGVVQFGHHSYNPLKDCPSGQECAPGTWHWDDISINPALPFVINPANQRTYGPAETRVTLDAPTAAGAALRFAGIGDNLQLSVDGGATWTDALLQPQNPELIVDEHFKSYFTPLPAGVTEVQLRGDNWWGGEWHVRDVSAWSR